MTTNMKIAVGLVAGLVLGTVLVWGGRGPRPGGPSPAAPLQVPTPETLGVVLPPEPVGRLQHPEAPAVPAGKAGRGLVPPSEETERMRRDGAILY